MKTSLKKLRGGLGIPKHQNKRERHLQQPLVKLDELSQAFQDMQDMRDCYDSLFSAAAATANSAYEFSESLREMGDCLLEKTALNDDEESGKVLLMLGKVQFSIQDLVDRYRSHIFQTITIPSESLLNELRIVEEMKKKCDEKRSVYEEMIPKCRGKGRLRSSKGGDHCSPRELQAARDEYEDDVSIFVFRMKSLKRGQSRSLLTQAARHHAAQMCFFSKALKSLEAIEPHVKFVTERQHIEYHFSGLEDDDGDDDGNDDDDDNDDDDNDDEIDDDSEDHDEGELSFDYGRQNDQGKDISTSRGDSMELDNVDLTFPKVSTMVDAMKEYSQRNSGRNSFIFGRDLDPSSKSAPLLVGKDSDPAGRFRPIRQSSSRKSYTYVLPTPNETKSPVSLQSDTQVPQTRRASVSGGGTTLNNWWHSSPLEQKKSDDNLECQKFSGPILSKTESVLRESNNNTTTSTRLPPPMTERRLSSQLDQRGDNKKIRRQAFSGPLAGKSWSNKSNLSASGPIGSTGNALLFSGSLLRTPLPRPSSSPLLSSSVSPTFMSSSPKISELHELPRPPVHLASKAPTNLRHSSPLLPKAQERSPTNKLMMPSNVISKLPIPPQTVHRSFSIPSRGQRETELHMSNTLEASQNSKMSEDIASPPLTLFSLSETGAG